MTFGASGRILLLSNETRLRSNKAVFKSVRGMHPWLKIRGKYKRGRLKSVSKPGRETAPGFSLPGRQRPPRNPQSKRTLTRMPRFQFFESSCLNRATASEKRLQAVCFISFSPRWVRFGILPFWQNSRNCLAKLSAACSCACYLPVLKVAGFPFCQRVQTDDKDFLVNFTFYREPVLSCCLQGAPVVGLQFTG